MTYDDPNPTAAARARIPSDEPRGEPPGNEPPPILVPSATGPLGQPERRPGEQFDASVPEDLRTPWGIADLVLFVALGFIALLVVGVAVAGAAMKGFGLSAHDLNPKSGSPATSMIALVAQGIWSGLVLLYFLAIVRSRTASPFWRTMGWRQLHLGGQPLGVSALRCLIGGALLAVFVQFAGHFLNPQSELPIEKMFHSRPTVILLMAFGILIAPLVEETMFRGFLYPVIARRFGVVSGVIVTGTLFGAMHAQQLWGGWGQIGLLIFVGILLTWVRARTGTVTASYFVHLGYNSLLFLGFFFATGGLRHIPGGS